MNPVQDVTVLILAGGQGSRMGGVDKGLQPLKGMSLVEHVLTRVRGQAGQVLINANRNLDRYQAFGYPVWPDMPNEQSGPLAGFLTGLLHCQTPWLATVPCDSPRLPLDLIARLNAHASSNGADIVMAAAPEQDRDGKVSVRPQPVFCLLHTRLVESLQTFMAQGGRKIDAWTAQHKTVLVPFDLASDDPQAFFNANTLAELDLLAAHSS
jgi:molybdenum cofactor guanylyltransferase